MQYGTNPMYPLSDYVVRDTTPKPKTITWIAFAESIKYKYRLEGYKVYVNSDFKTDAVIDFGAGNEKFVIIWV